MEEALLIERVVEEVWKRLQERQRRALVLFTGGTIGVEDALSSLAILQEQGWSFTAVVTPGQNVPWAPKGLRGPCREQPY